MTKIYMVRHCEAIGNLKRLFQGSSNFDITDVGAEQLKYLTEKFKDIPLDKVYSSPLLRAQKTALAVIGSRNMTPEIYEGLRELDGGIYEGKPFVESFNSVPNLADTWDNHPQDFAPENGEPMRDAYDRIWNAVKAIAAKNPNKTVACATHGGVLRCLHCRLLKGDISHLCEMSWSENTAVTLLEIENPDEVKIVYYNDVSHLPKDLIPSRSRMSSIMGNEKK